MDRMDRIKKMRNDECGMMNDERHAVLDSSFIIHHFFLILSIPVEFCVRDLARF
jgi:hypothetical protein